MLWSLEEEAGLVFEQKRQINVISNESFPVNFDGFLMTRASSLTKQSQSNPSQLNTLQVRTSERSHVA